MSYALPRAAVKGIYSIKLVLLVFLIALVAGYLFMTAALRRSNRRHINHKIIISVLIACITRIPSEIIILLGAEGASSGAYIPFYVISNSAILYAFCVFCFFWIEIVRVFFSNEPSNITSIRRTAPWIQRTLWGLIVVTVALCLAFTITLCMGKHDTTLYEVYLVVFCLCLIPVCIIFAVFATRLIKYLQQSNKMPKSYLTSLVRLMIVGAMCSFMIVLVNVVAFFSTNEIYRALEGAFLSFIWEFTLLLSMILYVCTKTFKLRFVGSLGEETSTAA